MKFRSSRILCVFLLAIAGCGGASTTVHSLKDPDYEGHAFRKVLVVAAFNSIEWQEAVEGKMVNYLRAHNVDAAASYQIFPPLRNYTDSEKVAICKKYRFDCYLAVTGMGVNNADLHVPSYTYGTLNLQATQYGVNGSGSASTSAGYTTTVAESMDVTFDLRDFQNGRTVCRCESNTHLRYSNGWSWQENTTADPSQAAESMCSSVGGELLRNHVFLTSPN